MRLAILLAALIVTGTVAYSFRFQSFMHAKELVWALGAPIAALLASRTLRNDQSYRAFLPLGLAIVLALFIHVLLHPAQLPERVLEACFRYALLLGIAALFLNLAHDPRANQLLAVAFILSAVITGTLAILQYARAIPWLFPEFPHYDQRAYSVFGNQDLLGGYMAFGIVAALIHLTNPPAKRAWLLIAIAILSGALLVSASRSAWLAAATGAALLLLRRGTCRTTAATLLIAALPAAILACILAPEATLARLGHVFTAGDHGAWIRLWIWDGTLRMIADHPLIGVGPGNYAYWTPSYLGEAYRAYGTFQHAHNDVHTLHAHNDWLELAAETGLLGTACVLWQATRLRHYRGPLWALLATILVFTQFNTTAHSIPHVLWALFLLTQMLHKSERAPADSTLPATAVAPTLPTPQMQPKSEYLPEHPTRSAAALTTLLVTSGAAIILTTHIPSALLRAAERAEPMQPDLYTRAIEYPWPNPDAHFAFGMALIHEGQHEPARIQLEHALRGNDTGAIHLALALLHQETGNTTKAAHHTRQAHLRWPWHPAATELHNTSGASDPG